MFMGPACKPNANLPVGLFELFGEIRALEQYRCRACHTNVQTTSRAGLAPVLDHYLSCKIAQFRRDRLDSKKLLAFAKGAC